MNLSPARPVCKWPGAPGPAPAGHGSGWLREPPLASPRAAHRAVKRAAGPRRAVSDGPAGAGLRRPTRDRGSFASDHGWECEGRRGDGLQGELGPEALLEGALQDQGCCGHVLERDSEGHAEEALAVVAAGVLEPGDELPQIGVELRDAPDADAAGPAD